MEWGIVDEIVAAGVKTPTVSLVSGEKTLAEVGFESVDSAFQYMVCIPQDETERILTDRLVGLGSEIERGIELVGLTQDEAGVT